VQQNGAGRRLKGVVSRSVATQLVERLALIALACGTILVLLPAVLRAVGAN
jgi:hypothetical protein